MKISCMCTFKVREHIKADDLGSPQCHHCSEMALTGNLSSKVWVASPGHEPLPLVMGSKRSAHWTSET